MRRLLSWTSFGFLAMPAAAQWGYVAVGGPPPTYMAQMCYDLAHGKCVLLRGDVGPETWTYDGSWQLLTPAHTPPGRRYASMVYDLVRGVVVVYGGRGSNPNNGQAADETFEWNGTDWTQMAPAGTPGGIESHAAAYDLARQRTVLYGGVASSWVPQALANTWEYDGAAWTQVMTATTPGPRSLAAACYHLQAGVTVLFGGVNPAGNVATDETWTYDGIDWHLVAIAGPKPPPRLHPRLVYDPARGVAMLFGGLEPTTLAVLNDLWEFDGSAWRQVGGQVSGIHPARAEGVLAMDLGRGRLVWFGGRTASTAVLDETWEYGAQFQTYGSGCAGSGGVPQLASAAPPRLGALFQVDVRNLPANPLAMMTTGTSRTSWALGGLPMLLTPFGLPGCRAYASAELVQPIAANAGTAQWSVQVPAQAGLLGAAFYQQAIAFDPPANAAGMVVSNAAAWVLGR